MIIFDPAPQEHTKSPGWCSRVPVWETSWGTAMSRGPGSACSGLVELTKKKQGSTSRLGTPQPFHHEQRRHKAGEGEEWPPTQLICPGKEICLMGNQEPEMLLA